MLARNISITLLASKRNAGCRRGALMDPVVKYSLLLSKEVTALMRRPAKVKSKLWYDGANALIFP